MRAGTLSIKICAKLRALTPVMFFMTFLLFIGYRSIELRIPQHLTILMNLATS